MSPGEQDLWFLPLGGCGEIGMNFNLYGHAGRWLAVDCGITFERDEHNRTRIEMPDPGFIAARADALCGLVITHAHEDHVGAVAHLWPQLRCPVYTTAFTAAILQRKLAEARLSGQVPVTVVPAAHRQAIGPFDVEWVGLTHSTPESQALVLRTPVGKVFHTGDWKLDPNPVLGESYSERALRALGDEGMLAMVCDSTNATTPGRSPSEGALLPGLLEQVESSSGRVIVGCFGSNVARLATLAEVARRSGRYMALLGRSLHNYVSAARQAGLWQPEQPLIEPAHLGYLPPAEVLAVATGSQGEAGAALHRLALGSHPDLDLAPDDRVLLSSRVIPGNEASVATLIRRLARLGVSVVQDQALNQPIHASGHPARDELTDLYRWVRPRMAIPVHGEPEHLAAHAALAADCGTASQWEGRNGDLFLLAPQRGIRRGAAPVGRLLLPEDGRRPARPPREPGDTLGA
ncbi:MAG: ribonuclease J [Pseudomonadota bacterium]